MVQFSQKRKGSVLVFSLLILAILLTSAFAVMSVAVVEQRSAVATRTSVVAFQAADSGAERVLRRMYIFNSPLVSSVAVDGDVGDDNLHEFASQMSGASMTATCPLSSGTVLTGTDSSSGYIFEISFINKDGNIIACNESGWRDKVVKLRSYGKYRGTSRVIEMGIRPRD